MSETDVYTESQDQSADWPAEQLSNSLRWRTRVYLEAKKYSQLGLACFPVERGGKASTSSSLNHNHATTNSATIDKWFRPESGTHAGFNIGIAAGGDPNHLRPPVMIVDLDIKKDESRGTIVDGEAELRRLEAEHGAVFPRNMVASTPSGGKHIFLAWNPHIKQGTNVLGKGIDVRSGTADKSNGHVVVYPSIVGGRGYNWIAGPVPAGELLPAPDWSMMANAQDQTKPDYVHSSAGGGEGNEDVSDDDILAPLPLSEALARLKVILSADCDYDTWIRVGRAIHSQWPGPDGLKMWDDWSARDHDRYKYNDCVSRWGGFAGGRVSIASLIYLSNERGYRGPASSSFSPIRIALERINEETPGTYVGGKVKWIRSSGEGGVYYMDLADVTMHHAIHSLPLKSKDGKKEKTVNPMTLWPSWKGRKLYRKSEMLPPPNVVPPDVYNIWQGFAVSPVPGDVQPWLDFMATVLPDDDFRGWVHDWLADMFQFPGNKPVTSLVFRGNEGIGKGFFADTVSRLFLRQNAVKSTNIEHIFGRFNDEQQYTVFWVLDEAIWSANHKHNNLLKSMITESSFVAEGKNLTRLQVPSCSHVVSLTNDEWAIPAGSGSRRFAVSVFPDTLKGNTEYWRKMNEWARLESTKSSLLYYYQNREITNNLRVVPENEALQTQRALTMSRDSKGVVLGTLCRLIQAGKAGMANDDVFFTSGQIREAWAEELGNKGTVPANAVTKTREAIDTLMGCRSGRTRVGWSVRGSKANARVAQIPANPMSLAERIASTGFIDIEDLTSLTEWEELDKDSW